MTVKRFIALMITFLSVLGTIHAEKPMEFRLENRSGLTIFVLRLSPAGSGVWTNDVLDGDVVADGKTAAIMVTPQKISEYWDVAVVDAEGNNYDWYGVRIVAGQTVKLPPPPPGK